MFARTAQAAALAATLAIPTIASSTMANAADPKLESRDFMIPSGDPGIQLFMRNKRPAGVTSFGPERTLLFVHGATYPAETAFDLPIQGVSMMDMIAARGYDVYLVDIRGYGGSTRPPEMSQPANANKPLFGTETSSKDFGTAVDHILKERNLSKINVMGWSWGTSTVGMYTSRNNAKVNRLVLYAPQWVKNNPTPPNTASLGAYRLVSMDSAKDRWLKDVPEDKKADLIPPGVFEDWAKATWATDPDAAKNNQMLRAPNGVAEDSANFWNAGKAQYDPGKITVPTLILHAEWDADLPSYLAQNYFKELKNAPYRRMVEIGEGTHTVMMEKNRMQFFRELMTFLDEVDPQALR